MADVRRMGAKAWPGRFCSVSGWGIFLSLVCPFVLSHVVSLRLWACYGAGEVGLGAREGRTCRVDLSS